MVNGNLEGSKCIELVRHDIFLSTDINKVNIYDIESFKYIDKLDIQLLEDTESREPNEIIAIQKCQNDEYIAVISGKKLIGNEEKINQLFVFRYVEGSNPVKFEKVNRVVLKEMSEFKQTCMNFHFENIKDTKERSKIIFAKKNQIFSLDFIKTEIKVIYQFKLNYEMLR